jgi:hypothetical protein
MAAALVYHDVPAEASRITAYQWQPGAAPVPLAIAIARDDGGVTITFSVTPAVIVLLNRRDGDYLLDGPLALRDAVVERTVDRVWRRTVGGSLAGAGDAMSPIEWLPANQVAGSAWPACWWKTAATWGCWGVPVDGAGVAITADRAHLLSAVVGGKAPPVLRPSMWGRLIVVTDRGDGSPPRLRISAARPAARAQRGRSVRLDAVALADVGMVTVAPGIVWVAGDSSPPESWLEIRSGRSGPQYVPLAGVAEGPALVPVPIALDDQRDIAAVVTSSRGEPADGALLSAFRLIDPVPAVSSAGQPPPRRVLAAEGIAAADGIARLDGLGDADYEIVAWHPQFGRSSTRLERGADHVAIRLQTPGIARGRVLIAGKPAGGIDVISVPDPSSFVIADDPIDLKGGDARTGTDGRFSVSLAPSGGGELRIGGGTSAIARIPLPHAPVPIVDVGDINLAGGLTLSVVLDQDPACDLRAAGPIGKSGLQIVIGTRTGPGLFSITLPEEGSWEFGLLCGRNEHALTPAIVRVSSTGAREVTLLIR